jgi:excisionase family DNA binding protein
MQMAKDRELSVKEAAAEADVHRNTIRRWIDEYGLEADRRGPKVTRIKASDLEAFKQKFRKE